MIKGCLKRKLVFGDVEQIKALKELRRQQPEIGNKAEYNVYIEIDGDVVIDASSKEEAESIDVRDYLNDCNIDITAIKLEEKEDE
jgi:hypothetical protein